MVMNSHGHQMTTAKTVNSCKRSITLTTSESGYHWTRQMVVPTGKAPRGWESPSTGLTGIGGILAEVRIKSPTYNSFISIIRYITFNFFMLVPKDASQKWKQDKFKYFNLHIFCCDLPSKFVVVSGESDHRFSVWVVTNVDHPFNLKH